MRTVLIRGIPIVVCTTDEDILANAQIGFSYGKEYWDKKFSVEGIVHAGQYDLQRRIDNDLFS